MSLGHALFPSPLGSCPDPLARLRSRPPPRSGRARMAMFLRFALLFLVAGCGAATPRSAELEPVRVTLRLPERGSLAYRIVARGGGSDQAAEGALFLERDEGGETRIVFRGDDALMGGAPRGPESIRMLFPTVDQPVGDEPVTAQWSVETPAGVALAVRDTIVQLAPEGEAPPRGIVRLELSRRIEVPDVGTIAIDGEGLYDVAQQRYVRLVTRQSMQRRGRSGGEGVRRVELRYDADGSEERTAERARIAAVAIEATGSYEAFVADHSADAEIAQGVQAALAAREPRELLQNAKLLFHLYASPVATWRLLLEGSSNEHEGGGPDLTALVQLIGSTEPSLLRKEQVLALVEPRIAQSSTALAIAMAVPDPRFRNALTAIGTSSASDEIKTMAREALERLDRVTNAQAGELLRTAARGSIEDLARVGGELLLYREDPSPLIDVLVGMLDEEFEDERVHAMVVEWLRLVTRRDAGADASEWRDLVNAHRGRPFSTWLVEASQQGSQAARMSALQGLATLEPTDESRAALEAALSDPVFEVRLAAAASLARFGDTRAVPTLLAALDDGSPQVRLYGFTSLAFLSPTTLGFDPFGEEIDRAAGLARFREWQRRAQ